MSIGLPGTQVKYITGRQRKPGQINGKSENLNNALIDHIFTQDFLSSVTLSLTSDDILNGNRPPPTDLALPTSTPGLNDDLARASVDVQHLEASPTPPPPPPPPNSNFDWFQAIPAKELIVVFDADMCAKADFFLKTLEVMADEDLQLCLTPQAFHNIDPEADLFNNINKQFWEVIQTGCWGLRIYGVEVVFCWDG